LCAGGHDRRYNEGISALRASADGDIGGYVRNLGGEIVRASRENQVAIPGDAGMLGAT
jgi:hypothetical protein